MDLKRFGLSRDDLESLGYSVKGKGGAGGADGLPTLAPAGSGTSDGWKWFFTLVALLILAWGSGLDRRLPAPVPANQPDTVFSSARAMYQLVEIARRPHPVGSPEHQRVREYLVERLQSLGLEPEVETVTFALEQDGVAHAGTLRHVLGRVRGTQSTGAVVVMANYDATPLSPGAGDNGTGAAAILEVLRAVSAGRPLRNDLVVLLTDGSGVELGAGRESLEEHPWMSDVRQVISVEMLGVSGPAITFSGEPMLKVPGPQPATSSLLRELPVGELLGADWAETRVAGVHPVRLVSLGGRENHHQVIDEAIRVNERTLQHHGTQILAMVRQLGRADLAAPGGAGADEAEEVYFSVTLAGLIHHPVGWGLLLTVGLVLGWALVAALVVLRKGSIKAPIVGLIMAALCVGASTGVGWALLDMLRNTHGEYGHLETAFFKDGDFFLALAALVLAVVSGIYVNARRLISADELIVGALVVPLVAAVWVSFRAPSAAMVFQWPLALALCATLILALSGPWIRRGRWVWGATMLMSAGILLVVVPHLELTASVLTFREAPLLGALLAIGMLLLLPAMEWLIQPSASWTPAAGILACIAIVTLSIPSVQGPEDHPTPSALLFVMDDTLAGSALRTRAAARAVETGGAQSKDFSGRILIVQGISETWARSWVAEPIPGSRNPGVLLVPQQERWEVAGAGPDAELTRLAMAVSDASMVEGRRRLRVTVRSGLGGEMLGVHLPGGGVLAGVDGTSLTDGAARPVRSLVHWGTSDGGTTTFEVLVEPDRETLEILVLEHHFRSEELLGEGFFGRDESLMPDLTLGSDRVIRRTRAVVPVTGAAGR